MNVIDQNLLSDEEIVYRTRHHRATLYIQPAVALLVAGFLWSMSSGIEGGVLTSFGLIAVVVSLVGCRLSFASFEAVLTNKRVLTLSGILSTKCNEILFTKVEAIDVHQNFIASMFGYGSVVITGSGGSKNTIPNIPDPFVFRRELQEQIAASQRLEPRQLAAA